MFIMHMVKSMFTRHPLFARLLCMFKCKQKTNIGPCTQGLNLLKILTSLGLLGFTNYNFLISNVHMVSLNIPTQHQFAPSIQLTYLVHDGLMKSYNDGSMFSHKTLGTFHIISILQQLMITLIKMPNLLNTLSKNAYTLL